MTIETVIEWAKANPAPVGFIASMFTLAAWVVACAFWRWVARRRKDKELGIVRRKGFVFLCGSKPDFAPPVYSWTPLDEPEPKPAPDLKYQGDQVTSLRKELMALEGRLGKLEAKDALEPPFSTGGVGLGPSALRLHQSVFGEQAPQPARYRVFRDALDTKPIYNLFYERGGWFRGSEGGWYVSMAALGMLLEWATSGRTSVTELVPESQEYREIVASFEAWRKGQ